MTASGSTKAVDLKPCPFCGGTNIEGPDVMPEDSYGNRVAWIECEGCGAQFEFCVGNEEAGIRQCSQAWNRRFAPEPAGWQPIETAPVDGRWFVGINKPSKCPFVVRYDKDERTWCDTGNAYRNPTHWAALPETKNQKPDPDTCKHMWSVKGVEAIPPDQQCGHGCGYTWAQRCKDESAVECRWKDGCRLAGVCGKEGVCHGRLAENGSAKP